MHLMNNVLWYIADHEELVMCAGRDSFGEKTPIELGHFGVSKRIPNSVVQFGKRGPRMLCLYFVDAGNFSACVFWCVNARIAMFT